MLHGRPKDMGTVKLLANSKLGGNTDFVRPYNWQVQRDLAALQTIAARSCRTANNCLEHGLYYCPGAHQQQALW